MTSDQTENIVEIMTEYQYVVKGAMNDQNMTKETLSEKTGLTIKDIDLLFGDNAELQPIKHLLLVSHALGL